jgi:hypothetical protein
LPTKEYLKDERKNNSTQSLEAQAMASKRTTS